MRRYFKARSKDLPSHGHAHGECHWIDLGSHGAAGKGWHVLAMLDDHASPHPNWQALPHLVDPRTRLRDKVDHKHFADLGLTGDETMIEAAERFGAIHPLLRH